MSLPYTITEDWGNIITNWCLNVTSQSVTHYANENVHNMQVTLNITLQ